MTIHSQLQSQNTKLRAGVSNQTCFLEQVRAILNAGLTALDCYSPKLAGCRDGRAGACLFLRFALGRPEAADIALQHVRLVLPHLAPALQPLLHRILRKHKSSRLRSCGLQTSTLVFGDGRMHKEVSSGGECSEATRHVREQ